MSREKIFKKMGFWNNFYLVLGVLSAILSVRNIIDTFITKSSLKQLESLGINPAEFEPSMLDKIMLIVTTAIGIYCIVIAFKNRNKIIEKVKVDIIPYVLTLAVAAYNFVMGIVAQVGANNEMKQITEQFQNSAQNVDQNALMAGVAIGLVIAIIILVIELLPSIRMLVLNNKLKNYPDTEENLYD